MAELTHWNAGAQFTRRFTCAAWLSVFALALSSVDAQNRVPALPRQPVHGVPVICGRKIEQFALMQNADFTPTDHFSTDPVHGISKGLLIPISEDADGVFYQASNGVTVGRPNPPFEHENVAGGVYVSKTKPGLAYAYTGDGRNPKAELRIMYEPLRKELMAKLLIASNAPPREKPKSKRSQ